MNAHAKIVTQCWDRPTHCPDAPCSDSRCMMSPLEYQPDSCGLRAPSCLKTMRAGSKTLLLILSHVVFISQGLLCHDLSAFPFLFTLLYWSLPYPFARISTLLFEKGSSTGPDVWPFWGVRGQIGEDGPIAVDIVRLHYLQFSFLDFYLESLTMENKTKQQSEIDVLSTAFGDLSLLWHSWGIYFVAVFSWQLFFSISEGV